MPKNKTGNGIKTKISKIIPYAFLVALALIAPALTTTLTDASFPLPNKVHAESKFGYEPADGPYSVVEIDVIKLRDSARYKEIPIKVYYPKAKGKFPVIIFSHGAGGSMKGYQYLGKYWASHGYISIHPTHYGSDTSILKMGDRKHNLKALKKCANDPKIWKSRPKDISFIIDSFDRIQRERPELKDKMDPSNIGVAGHSYGAYTAMAVAGMRIDMPGARDVSFKDDRARAFIALSPQGTGQMGIHDSSWIKITDPVMIISGSQDRGMAGQSPSWRLEAYKNLPIGNKFCVFIEGADHMSFAGSLPTGKDYSIIEDYVEIVTNAFWDNYLKHNYKARKYLESGEITKETGGKVKIEFK